jgi:tRNA(Ile)-lysidine synthase
MTATHRPPAAPFGATNDVLEPVDRAALEFVDAAVRAGEPIVLAVSGGCDSMVLMHAVALAWSRRGIGPAPRVLTFDHKTGPHATVAADLVAREAASLGLEWQIGHAELPGDTEAQWRAARWAFLRRAAPRGSRIATAHTLDDQLETVVMRAMRGAGARGLAGLAAASDTIVRPFVRVPRATLQYYGNTRRVPFVEDPTNASRAYLRNRVRLDLLPALCRARPRFAAEMLSLAERAAEWRREVDALARNFLSEYAQGGLLRVARDQLATYDSAALCVLWPAIAARASVTLDRRGTQRLAQFTSSGAPGARIQLSGGVEVIRHRESFIVRRTAIKPAFGEIPLRGVVQFGEWRFRPLSASESRGGRSSDETLGEGRRVQRENPWVAELPADRPLLVRAWRAGDRMRAHEGGAARRVKRFFGDARIPGPSREGWPVVLADDEILWIPGIRRSDAASVRSGRPVSRYACERFDGERPNG